MWSEDKLNKKFVVAENFVELVSKGKRFCLYSLISWAHGMTGWGYLTLFEAVAGGTFDRLNW